MAFWSSSSSAEKTKAGRSANERCGRWGDVDYLLTVGGLCMLCVTFWLGQRYEKFDAIWSLWRESEHDLERLTPIWLEHTVNISIVANAAEVGAVCLDGSPPAYFLDRGSDAGVNNWVVFLEGGGWCTDDDSCVQRSRTELGSSRRMPGRMVMGGVLSSSPVTNPDFYNWNRVLLKYCDGGSFNGDVSDPVEKVSKRYNSGKRTTAKIFYRGQRIWNAVMEELLAIGMDKAQKALLGGCSAGGLASILHCDLYRDLMPKETIVKCFSDAGFFIDVPDISGEQTIEVLYAKVVAIQNMVGNLPKSCTAQREAAKCIFPEYLMSDLSTPFFILNPAYDTWQFSNVLIPQSADPGGSWDNCRHTLSSCSQMQLKAVEGFRENLLRRLLSFLEMEKHGAFINSCYLHCQSQDFNWNGRGPKVDNKSISQVVGDWYFERNSSKVIDCPFPCNPTCATY